MKVFENLRTIRLPSIGQRIIKSALAVLIVYLIYVLRGYEGIPFYSAIGAIQCIQPYRESSKKVMFNRIFGTFNGAFYGMITILIDMFYIQQANQWAYFLLVSLMIIPVMYTSVACKRADVTYFCCVVFLSITIIHIGDENPVLFVLNRIIDTFIGIAVATVINYAHIPKKRDTETLFVTGLDETLLTQERKMTPYSLVELNRMIENGLKFTVATESTLATLIEANRGIHLKLPVIVFNGAVLYDLKNNKMLEVKALEEEIVKGVQQLIHEENICCFTTGVVQETLVIYYDEFHNETEEELYKLLRLSPYRNYHKGAALEGSKLFYMMAFGEDKKIAALYYKIKSSRYAGELRMVRMLSKIYPGYVYLKMYHCDCSKKKMLDKLKAHMGIDNVITIGTIPNQYDIVLPEENENRTVKCLKKEFEQYRWRKDSKSPDNQ